MIENKIIASAKIAVKELYGAEVNEAQLQVQNTREEFSGDKTLVVFPLLKISKLNPVETGNQLGEFLVNAVEEITGFNVVKGFLNLEISDVYWLGQFKSVSADKNFGFSDPGSGRTVMVEYSSPNTNKPLHIGHVRNILLGHSVGEILKANGCNVIDTQIVNDRGIHICKSMIAWQKSANGETPESAGMKGDKFVGKYYVEFNTLHMAEVEKLTNEGMEVEQAKKEAPIMKEAQEMLRKWEAKDAEVYALWEKMNQWCYDGFDVTYNSLGVSFDKLYFESETYLKGKSYVMQGVEKGHFTQRDDSSIWVDLTNEGLDEKILLRSDGTAVYMTQDIGTAVQRKEDYPELSEIVYTVGNEQDYHFKVLFKTLGKLGFDWADNCYHLSYGMVELPSGKMKSREGTVADADDLVDELIETAQSITEELGKLGDMSDSEKGALYEEIGMGALKYFMLKIDPKKKMLFDPKESVDFNGNTGPFIQYTHARISSILERAESAGAVDINYALHQAEKRVLIDLLNFGSVVKEAGKSYSPAVLANYIYDLVKDYNHFYHECPIFKADSDDQKEFRIAVSAVTADVIKRGLKLLGIDAPNRM